MGTGSGDIGRLHHLGDAYFDNKVSSVNLALSFSVGVEAFGKELELLKEISPEICRVAVLSNPANPYRVRYLPVVLIEGNTICQFTSWEIGYQGRQMAGAEHHPLEERGIRQDLPSRRG